jgi:hypothetical protein
MFFSAWTFDKIIHDATGVTLGANGYTLENQKGADGAANLMSSIFSVCFNEYSN